MENVRNESLDTKAKVLLIDDNQDFLDLLCVYLKSNGIEADAEYSGHKGLQRYLNRSEEYDVILLDMQLPDVDGNDVAARIYGDATDFETRIPIIAMSGKADTAENEEFSHYLRKPFQLETLLPLINSVLDAQRGNIP